MITIIKVVKEDIPEVKRVLSETWKDTYGGFLTKNTIEKVTSVWHDPERLTQQALVPSICFAVAKNENGKIVGLTTVEKLDENTLVMYRLYVLPQFQRQGIGKLLMQEAIKAFPETKKMRIAVEELNERGISFYKKEGFEEKERKQDHVGDQVLAVIVMEKELR